MKVEIINSENHFCKICELDYDIAKYLNKGDIIYPDGTGFAFIIEKKYVCMENGFYILKINVYEWRSFKDRIIDLLGFYRPKFIS